MVLMAQQVIFDGAELNFSHLVIMVPLLNSVFTC